MKSNKGDAILFLVLGAAMLLWLAIGLREVMNHEGSVASLVIVGHIAFGMEAYDSKKIGKFCILMLMAVTLAAVKIILI